MASRFNSIKEILSK